MKLKKPEIIIITAVDSSYGIGYKNKLLFHSSKDMVRFKNLTYGFPVIMGKNTWDSLPKKPLDGRLNIVITRDPILSKDFISKKTVQDAIDFIIKTTYYKKIFIIGGEKIYRDSLFLADKIEMTKSEDKYLADRFFPTDFHAYFSIEKITTYENISFITYKKNKFSFWDFLYKLVATKKKKIDGYPAIIVPNIIGTFIHKLKKTYNIWKINQD